MREKIQNPGGKTKDMISIDESYMKDKHIGAKS